MSERALVTRLAWMSGLLMALDVLAFTAASSLFLARMGADYLPLGYVLQGLVAMLIFGALARHLERANRVRTLHQALALSAGVMALLAIALYGDWPYAAFVAFLWASFQWTLHSGILMPALLPDWLSGLSQKKHTARLTIALSLGGIAGGALNTLLAPSIGVLAIWCLSVPLCGLCSFSLMRLVRHSPPRHAGTALGEDAAAQPSLRQHWALLREYPLVIYLASGCFVFILLYSLAEYCYFSVYQESFGDADQLGQLLGALRVAADLIQIALLKFVTGPGLQWFGVATMSLVYPLGCLLSFAALAIAPGLPAALMAQLNSSAFKSALNQPIQSLCFNAMPHRLIALSRSLCEGSVQSLGLVAAGLLLGLLSLLQLELGLIAALATLLSLLFLWLRYQVGRHYKHTLHRLTVEGVIELPVATLDDSQQESEATSVRSAADHPTSIELLIEAIQAEGPQATAAEGQLAMQGSAAVTALGGLLQQTDTRLRHRAQRILARLNSPEARAQLQSSLNRDYRTFEQSWHWLQTLPANAACEPLRLAIENFQFGLHRQLMQLLAALGHSELVPAVQAVLHAADDYRRSQALELLLSFRDRDLVRPLTPLFETMAASREPEQNSAGAWDKIARAAQACEDVWIARAANYCLDSKDTGMDKLLLLRKVGFFESLAFEDLNAIAEALVSVNYLPGEGIFSQGEPGENLFILVQGQVRLSHSDAQECRSLGLLGPGEAFGEMALLDDAPRSASAEAVMACHLLKLHKLQFVGLIQQRPEIALAVARVLSRRLRDAQAIGAAPHPVEIPQRP